MAESRAVAQNEGLTESVSPGRFFEEVASCYKAAREGFEATTTITFLAATLEHDRLLLEAFFEARRTLA